MAPKGLFGLHLDMRAIVICWDSAAQIVGKITTKAAHVYVRRYRLVQQRTACLDTLRMAYMRDVLSVKSFLQQQVGDLL